MADGIPVGMVCEYNYRGGGVVQVVVLGEPENVAVNVWNDGEHCVWKEYCQAYCYLDGNRISGRGNELAAPLSMLRPTRS